MRGDYDPTNIKPIATKDLISWAYQVSAKEILTQRIFVEKNRQNEIVVLII
jgi:hypothetical protein